jgi:sulfur carrier protein
MEIELNGLPHLVKDRQNVGELVDELNLARQALAVAVNREVVPRSLWSQRVLQPNDRVDLVRPIGGG